MIYAPGGGVSVGQQGGITTGEVTIDASGVIVKVRLDSTAHNDGGAYTFHYTINLTGQVPQFSISSLRGGDRIEVEAGHGAAMGLRVGPQSYGEQNAFGTYSVSLVSTNSDAPKLGIGCQGVRCVLQ
jgi:hypothetical protein